MTTATEPQVSVIKVLLVEDSPTEALIIRASLEEAEDARFETTHVACLADALEALGSHYYHIVLLDLTLPDSQGIETFTRVHDARPGVPVVILTANASRELAVQSVQLGAQDYLVKEQVENLQLVLALRYALLRAEAEARQQALLEEVARANGELERFAYTVSHDLKAPLRGVRTVVDWIVADYDDRLDDRGREYLSLLAGRVTRMHELINGVLRYSRAGRLDEEPVEVDLNELVTEVVDLLAPPDPVQVTLERPLPRLRCQRTRLEQVFQNLISNAIKYLDKPRGCIAVAGREEADQWHFTVADNGCGIPEQQFERIFEMFVTLNAKDVCESTGVGLPIVKRLVESVGGRLWLESEVGVGTTFHVLWPKEPPRDADDQPAR